MLPFIATLGMLGVARGAAKWLGDQQTVNVPPTWVNELAVTFPTPAWLLVAPGVWLTLLLAIVMTVVLARTVFGRRVFAIGSNEAAARACGVATNRVKVAIYGLAGLFFGLSGVMQMSRLRQGDPTVAIGTELDIIAAVVIGGGSLAGGEGTIAGAMVGALTMAFLRNGTQQMGWPNYIQEIIIGIIIVLAVAADRVRRARGRVIAGHAAARVRRGCRRAGCVASPQRRRKQPARHARSVDGRRTRRSTLPRAKKADRLFARSPRLARLGRHGRAPGLLGPAARA